MNWLPANGRVELYCEYAFNYWNGIVPGYIHNLFKPSLCRSKIKIKDGIGHTFAENKYRAKKLILCRTKNMVQNKQ